jgi:tRNA1(Val) A37 N6-methylase TrmN6
VRLPRPEIVGLERDPAMAALARDNIHDNGLADRAAVIEGDVAAGFVALAPVRRRHR